MVKRAPRGVLAEGRRAARRVTPLRDQIAAPARTILLVLLAAAAVVFVIACSNVANLILARSVRREGELAVRAALGASHGALRRTLLAESLVLCGAGAVLGVLLARPFVAVVARYAARFSVRALDVTVDASVLWVGAGLAMAAAVLLAYVPRLPSPHARRRPRPGERQRPDHAGHQPPPAGVRDDPDRVLVRAARRRRHAARHARRAADGGHRLRHAAGARVRRADVGDRRRRAPKRHRLLSGSDAAHRPAAGRRRRRRRQLRALARRRQLRRQASSSRSTATRRADGEERSARREFRIVAPALLRRARRADRSPAATSPTRTAPTASRSSIVSQSVAQRLFPNGDALNRHMWWTDPLLRQEPVPPAHRRRRGGRGRRERAARAGDDGLSPRCGRWASAGRLFVHAAGDPVRARAGGHAHHPRDLAGPARRARGDARGRARGGAGARAGERVRVLRIRRHRAAHRRRRRRGRAGVLGQRADARVRRPAGRRIRAAASAGPRAVGRRWSSPRRDCRRRGGRLRARAPRGRVFFVTCRCPACCRWSARRPC